MKLSVNENTGAALSKLSLIRFLFTFEFFYSCIMIAYLRCHAALWVSEQEAKPTREAELGQRQNP